VTDRSRHLAGGNLGCKPFRRANVRVATATEWPSAGPGAYAGAPEGWGRALFCSPASRLLAACEPRTLAWLPTPAARAYPGAVRRARWLRAAAIPHSVGRFSYQIRWSTDIPLCPRNRNSEVQWRKGKAGGKGLLHDLHLGWTLSPRQRHRRRQFFNLIMDGGAIVCNLDRDRPGVGLLGRRGNGNTFFWRFFMTTFMSQLSGKGKGLLGTSVIVAVKMRGLVKSWSDAHYTQSLQLTFVQRWVKCDSDRSWSYELVRIRSGEPLILRRTVSPR
jgi:hypothetical protein